MGLYSERSSRTHTNTMMKLVVLAVAVSAVCGGLIPAGAYSGLPIHGAYSGLGLTGALAHSGYSGLPVHGAYSGPGAYGGLPVAGAYSGLLAPTVAHTGYSVAAGPVVHGAAPVVRVAPAPAIVAPQPYSVHTGTKVAVAAEPVEHHGYVIKY